MCVSRSPLYGVVRARDNAVCVSRASLNGVDRVRKDVRTVLCGLIFVQRQRRRVDQRCMLPRLDGREISASARTSSTTNNRHRLSLRRFSGFFSVGFVQPVSLYVDGAKST